MENLLLFFAVLLITSILLSKISDKFGILSLIIFLGVGMLALIFILYAGGLDTDFAAIKPIFGRGLALATLGVF